VLESIQNAPEFYGVDLKDVNQRGIYGNTPLSIAVVRGSLGQVRVLLNAGADVNAILEDGRTALHEAVGQNHSMVAQLLLDHGALTTVRDRFGRTPIELAELLGHSDAREILNTYSALRPH
jgi:ankyrin repeat protein